MHITLFYTYTYIYSVAETREKSEVHLFCVKLTKHIFMCWCLLKHCGGQIKGPNLINSQAIGFSGSSFSVQI